MVQEKVKDMTEDAVAEINYRVCIPMFLGLVCSAV